MFSGRLVLTKPVRHTLSAAEIAQIINDLLQRVEANEGADYIQKFTDVQGRSILCVDQLSKSMKASGAYSLKEIQQNDFWIMMFAHEH